MSAKLVLYFTSAGHALYRAAGGRLLEEATRLHGEAPRDDGGDHDPSAALVDLCRGLLNVNEFVFID